MEPDWVSAAVLSTRLARPKSVMWWDAVLVDEDIGGLEITVQDAALVGVVNGVGHVGQHADAFTRIQDEAADFGAEVAAFDELHREVGQTVVFAKIVDGDDVGVFECGGAFSFGAEPLDDFGIGQGRENHLERDTPVEADLARFVDDTHAAAREFADDFVVAEVDG